jgi:hypothetical protein
VPWFRLDIHWYEDPEIELAASSAGGVVFAVFPVLLAKAKASADGGRVEFTWGKLARELYFEQTEIEAGIDALVSAGVLTCPQRSAWSARIAFNPASWRRWQEAARKAAAREEAQAA